MNLGLNSARIQYILAFAAVAAWGFVGHLDEGVRLALRTALLHGALALGLTVAIKRGSEVLYSRMRGPAAVFAPPALLGGLIAVITLETHSLASTLQLCTLAAVCFAYALSQTARLGMARRRAKAWRA